jgi:thiamine-phosphate pyrophosphorylase
MKSLWITDRKAVGDARFREILRSLRGAPGLSVQLREKAATDRERLHWARDARQALGPDVALYVNGRFDVALEAGADGVHLPADGLPLAAVRAVVPRGFRVGVSTHSPEEARRAIDLGADLVVIGPIFATPDKERYGPPLSAAALDDLPPRHAHDSDVYAVGGIDGDRLSEVASRKDRVDGVAAIRYFQNSPDPLVAAQRVAAL